MRFLEEQIPELADLAVKKAYLESLIAGNNVLISENGKLVEIRPDGTKKIIKQLPPSTPVTKGKTFNIP